MRDVDDFKGGVFNVTSYLVIAKGGMGEVYEARDTRLGRRVAVKVIRPDLLASPGTVGRFLAEAGAAARVEHPNVVRVYGVHEQDGQYAIEMEFIAGSNLRELMQSGPVPPAIAARLLGDILCGLQACHEAGVIHCDLKPGNVLIDRNGMAHLADFGIARVLGEQPSQPDAEDPVVWGTPPYLPPEACDISTPAYAWDLYATGVMMREVLTGTRALAGAALPLPDGLSDPFAALVESLSAEDTEHRPASAADALKQLKRTPEFRTEEPETGPIPASPRPAFATPTGTPGTDSGGAKPSTGARMRTLAWGVGAMAAAVVVVGILVYAAVQLRPDPESAPPEASAKGATTIPEYKRREAQHLSYVNDLFYFSFDDGIHGRELWSTNHGGGAELVADLNPGPKSSNPTNLIPAMWGLFFAASTEEHGAEPWVCTGKWDEKFSVASLGDLNPGPMGSTPRSFFSRDNLVIFYACTHDKGWEPWATLGGAEHTALLGDLHPGVHHSLPMSPRFVASPFGGYLVAISGNAGMMLYCYRGEENATAPVMAVSTETRLLGCIGQRLLFSNEDAAHGLELWSYDPARDVGALVADISPGASSSNPAEPLMLGNRLLFQAHTATHGKELWVTDGTAAGTTLLRDINPGSGDGDPYGFVLGGDRAYMRAFTADTGRELWCTDGTTAGTSMVADLWPGLASSDPYNLSAYEDRLFFTANDGKRGAELWSVTWVGDKPEIALVVDVWPGETGSEPRDLKWSPKGFGAVIVDLPPGKPGIVTMDLSTDTPALMIVDLSAQPTKPEVN